MKIERHSEKITEEAKGGEYWVSHQLNLGAPWYLAKSGYQLSVIRLNFLGVPIFLKF